MMGRPYASVFPEPCDRLARCYMSEEGGRTVCATPTTSLPFMAGGRDAAWMGVGLEKFFASKAFPSRVVRPKGSQSGSCSSTR